MKKALDYKTFRAASLAKVGAMYGLSQHEFFNLIHTTEVITEVLHRQFNDDEFNKFIYKAYINWHNKNYSKLGRALK